MQALCVSRNLVPRSAENLKNIKKYEERKPIYRLYLYKISDKILKSKLNFK